MGAFLFELLVDKAHICIAQFVVQACLGAGVSAYITTCLLGMVQILARGFTGALYTTCGKGKLVSSLSTVHNHFMSTVMNISLRLLPPKMHDFPFSLLNFINLVTLDHKSIALLCCIIQKC